MSMVGETGNIGGDLLNVHGQAARRRDLLNVHGQAATRRGFTKCPRNIRGDPQ